VSADQPGAMELEAISGRSGAALSAPIANLPQEVRHVSALEDLGEDPDPEAEVAANVEVLHVVATANVGTTTSLTQTKPCTSRKSDIEVDIGIGRGDLTPVTATEIFPTPSYQQSLQTSSPLPRGHDNVVFLLDPSLAPNVGPAGTSGVGRFPPLAMGSEVGPTSRMYAVPPRDIEVEQPESVLLEQGRVARSETSE